MRSAVTASSWGIGRGSTRWRSLTWILLLSFALQSYITQTNIHLAAPPAAKAPIVKTVNKAPAPADRDPLNCPFCQAIASAGAFFTSAAPLLPLPSLWAEVAAPLASVGVARRTFTHGWQSRAPPRH